MKLQKTYKRKLAGSCFLGLRILSDFVILTFALKDLFTETSTANFENIVYCLLTLVDALLCVSFNLVPSLTCEGNTYLKCLPFVLNSCVANFLRYAISLPGVYYYDRRDKRIPSIAIANIITLVMYGGLASPLNLAWMETFKPFSIVILKNKKQSAGKH